MWIVGTTATATETAATSLWLVGTVVHGGVVREGKADAGGVVLSWKEFGRYSEESCRRTDHSREVGRRVHQE
jgi:hypothetical protein